MGQQGRGEGGGAGQGRVSGLKRSCVAGPLCLSTYSLTRYNCLSNSFFRAQGYSRRVFLFQLFADLSELSTFFGGSAGNVLAMGSSLLAPKNTPRRSHVEESSAFAVPVAAMAAELFRTALTLPAEIGQQSSVQTLAAKPLEQAKDEPLQQL